MEVQFAKFWFEDLLSLHVRAQGKKKNQTKNKELQRFACLDDRELDDVSRWNVQANTTNYAIKCGVKILPMKFSHLRWLEIVFSRRLRTIFKALKNQLSFFADKPISHVLTRGLIVMTIAIILLVLISVWERSRKFLDRFSHNSMIFFIEIMPRCRTYFNKWNLSFSKLWRRLFYSWIFSVSTWNYFQKELKE